MPDYKYKKENNDTAIVGVGNNIPQAKDVHVGLIKSDGNLIRPMVFSKKKPLARYNYNQYVKSGRIIPSEFDLYQILQASNIDGYMKRAIKIKTAVMFKSGWELTGKNPETVAYIKKRFRELSIAGGYPIELLLRDMGRNFIRYSNAFLVKVRGDNGSGRSRTILTKRGKTTLKPVLAYFILPPETVHIETDDDGDVIRYHQIMDRGATRRWPAYNVVHFFFDRMAGYHMGTPVFWPALDDIRALRRIEENVEYLVYYYVFPFFVVYVGTDDAPPAVYPDGTTEIDVVTRKINSSPSEGGMVLSYRHKIEVKSFDNVLPVNDYIEHFKKRVFADLGVSSVDMGEGSTANRNTADSLTRQMIDDVKDYQQVFASFVNYEIIMELLLESPWGDKALDDDNIVAFSFNEIDMDNRIKIENHNALMYQMNAITEDEMRQANNREPIQDKQRSNTYLEIVQKPLAMIGKGTEVKTKGGSTTVGENKGAATKEQPTNQHGKNLGPTKAKSSENNTIGEIIQDFAEKNSEMTLDDLQRKMSSIDYIKEKPLITERIKTAISFCKEYFKDETDKRLIANVFSSLVLPFVEE